MAERPGGVRIGIDVGAVRVGVAASDPDGLLATPVATIPATEGVARVAQLVAEHHAAVVYVGLPRHLSGVEGAAAHLVRAYSWALAQAIAPVSVRLVDERLTTVAAHQALHASGRSGRRHREVVDQAAAVTILQSAIDAERARGGRVGELVPPQVDPDGSGSGPAQPGRDRMERNREGLS